VRRLRTALILSIFLFGLSSTHLLSQSEEATAVFMRAKESVIAIVVKDDNETEIARGTGFLIAPEVMVTAYHLVSQAKEAEGRDIEGKKIKIEGIIRFDPDLDVAVAKAKRKDPLLAFGDSDSVGMGNKVYAVGSKESGEISVFEANVTGLLEYAPNRRVLDTDVSATQELTGAPVLDAAGRIVGIQIFLDSRSRFVLPSNAFKSIPKIGDPNKFKDTNPVEYFKTLEGIHFASRLYYTLEDTSKAEMYLKEMVKMKPDDLDSYTMLASVYSKQRNYTSAISAYQKVLELSPDSDSVYMGMGTVYLNMMKYKEAIPPLTKAVELNPENKEAYFYIGNAHEQLREFDKAAAAYEKYIASNPEDPGAAQKQLGLCYLELEDYPKAIVALNKTLESSPDEVDTNLKLAQAYQKSEQYENAEMVFERLAKLVPEDAKIYYNNIIMMYDQADMPDQAIEATKKMIALEPDNAEAVYNLGYMYVKLDRYEEAIDTFEKVLEMRTDMEYAYLQLGFCYSKLNRFQDLVDISEKFVQVFPDNGDGWQNIAIGNMQLKRFSQAIEPLKKALEIKPDNGIALYNLGICYLNLRNKDAAIDAWERLKNVDAELAQRLYRLIAR